MSHSFMGLFGLCASILSLTLSSNSAIAQSTLRPESSSDYPRKSVRLIVPYAAGGGVDIIARIVAQKVSDAWGQSIVVDNRGGAGSTIGTNIVAKSTPDGYTVLLTSISIAYTPALYRKLPFDTERELAAVILITKQPSVLVVHPTLPAKSVSELVALAKSKPGGIRYGSGGSGSASHLATELFRATANINVAHVPYKGIGPATTALMAGETDMVITNMASLQHVRSGKLRALAVTGSTRANVALELPTIAEAGLPGYEFDGWYGVLVTARTPNAIINKINEEFNRALAAHDVRERLASAGIEPLGGTPEQFATYLASEIKKWTKVVRTVGIHAD